MPNVDVAFRPETLDNTLGAYLASKGMTQLRIAETEKYARGPPRRTALPRRR